MKRILFCILLCAAVPAFAQKIDLTKLYDLDSFSAPDTMFAPKNANVKVKATLAPLPGVDENGLVVEADIASGWHVYSVTQKEGGTIPTTFKFPEGIGIKAIFPTAAPHLEKIVGFDVPIESHEGKITWIVRLDARQPVESLHGTLKGQVCSSGEGGVCVQMSIPFDAVLDATYDVAPLLGIAETVSKEFQYRKNNTSKEPGTELNAVPGSTPPKDAAHPEVAASTPSPPALDAFSPKEIETVQSLGTALLYAFLGGIILNFMPCVLPVIGLKIMSFFEQAGKSRFHAFVLNFWYSLGLLSVFLVLAWFSIGLSKMFTFDLFNILMVCVVFAMALSLMGLWELSAPAFLGSGKSVALMQQEGSFGAFFKGIITTLLAIPCGAPLLSPAVNWAGEQSRMGNDTSVFAAYTFIGLGMASPYLVLGAFPELLRFLPKPGAWMETFKKAMGFCLLGAVVWILSFVRIERLLSTVALMFAIWFVCWMIGRLEYTATAGTRIRSWLISLAVLATVFLIAYRIPGLENSYNLEDLTRERLSRMTFEQKVRKHWKNFTPEAFETALKSGKTVVVDFTADWCVTCKVLEATVLNTEPITKALEANNIESFIADCTHEDGAANRFLQKFGTEHVPVPLLAIFDPKNPTQPTVIRGGYTQKTLLKHLGADDVQTSDSKQK